MAVDIRAAASGDVSLFVTLRLNYLAYAAKHCCKRVDRLASSIVVSDTCRQWSNSSTSKRGLPRR